MIEWREILYLDETMTEGDRVSAVKEMAEREHPVLPGVKQLLLHPAYGVFLAQNPANLLEIISLNEFLQPGYGTRIFRCVGLAGSKSGAERLVQAILTDTLRERGDLQVREFLYPTDKEGEEQCFK